ncbi:MAG TPA: PKD domain-containing protein [Candidatus Absconditabacterales bacterium]|nr:PKD domain-containing protein [Candidatus Absconditabacterales bacterium]HRU50017.1 PKD domain-containing protein [Candidatus Absconditabacterales bacterium]
MVDIIASFTQDIVSGDFPLRVQFTNTSTPTPSSSWRDFGDGCFSTDTSPRHTFWKEGEFDVALSVRNDSTDNVFSTDISVDAVKVNAEPGLDNLEFTDLGRSGGRSYPPIRENPERPIQRDPGDRGNRTDPIVYY